MSRTRPKRTGTCVYCGAVGPLTRDHVPPKTLFALSATNLVTVPCCPECNQRASQDDEYFRLALVMRQDTYYHSEAHSLLESVYRAFRNPMKVGFKRAFVDQLRPIPMVDNKGRLVGETGAYTVDANRLARVVERVTRGLFYHDMQRPLPSDYTVKVVNEHEYLNWTVEARQHFEATTMQSIMAHEPKYLGHDVFFYRAAHVDTDPFQSVWQMVFYRRVGFIVFTLSPTTVQLVESRA